jgi:hypothetical protein
LLNQQLTYKKILLNELDEIPVFFILSRPRTGSTLLRTLFDAHPNVQIPPECQFIINLYPKYGECTHWTTELIEAFVSDLSKQFLFNTWKLSSGQLREILLSLSGNISYGNMCKAVYWHYQSLFDKKKILRIGDKNPGYALYIHLLAQIFPEAKFIHLTRDYRDNHLSLARVEFELPFISLTTYKWKYFYKTITDCQKTMPERFATIRYEDLVNNPHEEMKALCDFLELPFDESVFSFYLKKEAFKKLYPEDQVNKIHASLMNPLTNSKSGLWKTQLTNRQKAIADYTVGLVGQQAGYQRSYTKHNFTIRLLAQPGIMAGRLIYFTTHLVNRFVPYKQRQYILSELPFVIGSSYKRIFK